MTEFVELTQMLFPFIINNIKECLLFEATYHLTTLVFVSLTKRHDHVVHALAIRKRNKDILIHITLVFIHVLDYRISHIHQHVHLALECFERSYSQLLYQIIITTAAEFGFIKRHLHCEHLKHVHHQCIVIERALGICNHRLRNIVNHIGDIYAKALTHQRMVAFCVNHITLLIHHIIVFKQVLTNAEVVFFHFLLRTFNR